MSPSLGKWELSWIGTLIGGFVIELANKFWLNWWERGFPLNLLPIPYLGIGVTIFLGWIVIWIATFSIAFNLTRINENMSSGLAWVLSWITVGSIAEVINLQLYRMWTYKGLIANLYYSIYYFPLIPILGWGAVGIVTLVFLYVAKVYSR